MTQQQSDPRANLILMVIIAIIAGPIGWVILLIWLLTKTRSSQSLKTALLTKPETAELVKDIETKVMSANPQPIEIGSGPADQKELWRIIFTILLLLVLIGSIAYILLT